MALNRSINRGHTGDFVYVEGAMVMVRVHMKYRFLGVWEDKPVAHIRLFLSTRSTPTKMGKS